MLDMSHTGLELDHVLAAYHDRRSYCLRKLPDAHQRFPIFTGAASMATRIWGSWVFPTIVLAWLTLGLPQEFST
jgi:hypothetical protein